MKSYTSILLSFICLLTYAKTDKYRLILREDPATSITIAWNQISGDDAWVYYGEVDYGTAYDRYENIGRISRETSYRGMENKFVRLNNLKPNTAYYFVLKDNEGVSKRFWFKTAPNDKSRLSFIAGGDSRNNREPRQKANTLVSKLKPHAVLFGGDMTNLDTNSQWREWMDDWQLTTASDGRMFPIVAARGNHENASVIYNLFDSPNNDSYFALTFGDNLYRFYTLNTLISVGGNQKNWLENDLKQNQDVIWRSAQYHYPMRAHTSGKFENIFVYSAWADLFYNYDVRLVVECDSHTVKTTYPLKPSSGYSDNDGFVVDNLNGTIYTGEGCWGAPLRDNDDDKAWTQSSGRFNQFKLIFVEEDKIELRTIRVDNANEVTENSNENVFNLPSNLDVWEMDDPAKTNVVYIYQAINADFSKQMSNIFNNTTFNVQLDFTSNIENVKEAKFKATNLESGLVTFLGSTVQVTSPYEVTVPNAGTYKLTAEIERNDGEVLIIEKNIFVGDYSANNDHKIFTGSNDINERENGDIDLGSNELYLGYRVFEGQQSIGLRFENINIPKNATIDYAYIQFTPSATDNDLAEGLIQIEDSPNSAPFADVNSDLKNRTKATEELMWRIPNWSKDIVNEQTQTPDLSNLLQNIVNKRNWKHGNAVSISINPIGVSLSDNNAHRRAYAYENDPAKSPKLVYGYSYKSSVWAESVTVSPGIGINTLKPSTSLDVNGLMRSTVRNEDGQMFECTESIEGAIGYDNIEKTIKVCTEKDGVYEWKIIDL